MSALQIPSKTSNGEEMASGAKSVSGSAGHPPELVWHLLGAHKQRCVVRCLLTYIYYVALLGRDASPAFTALLYLK